MADPRAWLLLGVFALAAVLRFHGIGARSLWVDEANTWIIARESWSGVFGKLAVDSSPPLYYLLLHSWMGLFGSSEAAMRALSAVFGLGLVLALFMVGRRWISPAAGLWAAAIAAISSEQVFYSQQVRMYTLLPLLLLLSTHALLLWLQQPQWRRALAYGALLALALLTHNFALYFLPAHALVVLLQRRAGAWLVQGVVLALGVAQVYLPWVPILLRQARDPETYAWFQPLWESWGPLEPLTRTLSVLAPGGRKLAVAGDVDPGGLRLAAILFLLLGGWGLWVLAKRRQPHAPHVGMVLAGTLVVPPVLAVLVSHLWIPSYVPGRVGQGLIPSYTLLVAAGAAALPRRRLRIALAVGVALVSLWAVRSDLAEQNAQQVGRDRELARILRARVEDGDAVLFNSITRFPLEYYLGDLRPAVRFATFPRYNEIHMGGLDGPLDAPAPGAMQAEAEATLDGLIGGVEPGGSLFVVLLVVPVAEPLRAALLARSDLEEVAPPWAAQLGGTAHRTILRHYRVRDS